jgi:hypothetical protein
VTDLVTLGSPLTHLGFLSGQTDSELKSAIDQRELPACPPRLDDGKLSYTLSYTVKGGERTFQALHHGACFAATRWTNLYFPHNGFLQGDLIGGPLAGKLGWGIDDQPVRPGKRTGLLSHLDYWAAPHALESLRNALRLPPAS